MSQWAHPLEASAAARPTHPALAFGEALWSFAELREQVARLATVLRRRIEAQAPGTATVALIAERSPAFALLAHAVIWAGYELIPLAPGASQEEARRNRDVLREQRATLIELDRSDELIASAHTADLSEPAPWSADRRLLSILTSGTTGTPKLAALTAEQLVFSCFGSAARLGHHLDDRWLATLPLHHIGGFSILLRSLVLGTTVQLEPTFDAAHTAALLDSGTITLVSLVPAMLQAVLDARAALPFPPQLRAILLGGAATPPGLIDRCRSLGVPLSLTWGMSETASQIATAVPGTLPEPGQRAELPLLPFVEAEATAHGLKVRGPIAPKGELTTSDLGEVRSHRVCIHGRGDDVFISGGENIHPGEIEHALMLHPSVQAALVVAVPHARWGQRPIALIETRDPPPPDLADALRSWCHERLTSYKVPDRFVLVPRIPRTPLGKSDRSAARQLALTLP